MLGCGNSSNLNLHNYLTNLKELSEDMYDDCF